MVPPEGFDAGRLETWPQVTGRLEYVGGRLLYMPPIGDLQQDTTTDVVITLGAWVRRNPAFILGTNEAGMRLAGATRAADAAIWRRKDLGPYEGGLRRVPPVLAVEVAGPDEGDSEQALRDKAKWYLGVGVKEVWIVLPSTREVLAISPDGERRFGGEERIEAHPELHGLNPKASEVFAQILSRD
jgi:Uma2 family endonuclease